MSLPSTPPNFQTHHKSIHIPLSKNELLLLFKNPFFYFIYQLLYNISHPTLYFTLLPIKILWNNSFVSLHSLNHTCRQLTPKHHTPRWRPTSHANNLPPPTTNHSNPQSRHYHTKTHNHHKPTATTGPPHKPMELSSFNNTHGATVINPNTHHSGNPYPQIQQKPTTSVKPQSKLKPIPTNPQQI